MKYKERCCAWDGWWMSLKLPQTQNQISKTGSFICWWVRSVSGFRNWVDKTREQNNWTSNKPGGSDGGDTVTMTMQPSLFFIFLLFSFLLLVRMPPLMLKGLRSVRVWNQWDPCKKFENAEPNWRTLVRYYLGFCSNLICFSPRGPAILTILSI